MRVEERLARNPRTARQLAEAELEIGSNASLVEVNPSAEDAGNDFDWDRPASYWTSPVDFDDVVPSQDARIGQNIADTDWDAPMSYGEFEAIFEDRDPFEFL